MVTNTSHEHYFKGAIENKDTTKLKEVISMYLNAPNLSFLLGSGCSCGDSSDPGIPTMTKLKETFWELNSDFLREKDFKENIALRDLNLEQLAEYLQAKKLVNIREDAKTDKVKTQDAIQKIQEFIITKIISGMDSKHVINTYKSFYRSIENSTRKNPVNIFTTNYDLYNEKALDELGYSYNDGFLGTYRRVFNPMVYNYTLVDNMNLHSSMWQRIPNFVNLYKIHGSISWYPDNEDVIMRNSVGNDENDFKEPVLIYPTPMKDRTTLMAPYSDLLRCMQNELLKDNATLITFGYSFNDEHVNRIILNALAVPSFHLIVFNDSEKARRLISLNSQRISVIYGDSINDIKDEETKKETYKPIHYFDAAISTFFALDDTENEILEKFKTRVKEFLSTNEELKHE